MKPLAVCLGVTLLGAALAFDAPALAQRTPTTPAGYYQEEFLAAVQRNLPVLRPCYEAARAEGDAAWARLRTLTVILNPDGTIGTITLNPGPGVASIEACMRPIFERWHLTPPVGGAMPLTYTRLQLQRAMEPPRPPRRRR